MNGYELVRKQTIQDTEISKRVEKTGDTMTGNLTLQNSNLILDKAQITNSNINEDTLKITGTTNQGTGAIELGTGGARIYGIDGNERVYLEGGFYTNKNSHIGGELKVDGIFKLGKESAPQNDAEIWGCHNAIRLYPKRVTGYQGGVIINWTGVPSPDAPTPNGARYEIIPSDDSDTNLGSNNNKFRHLFIGDINGYKVGSSANQKYKIIPTVETDGVMDIGRYIDFHKSNTSQIDKDYRISLNEFEGADVLDLSGRVATSGAIFPTIDQQGGFDVGLPNRRYYTVYCVNVNQVSDKNSKENIEYLDNKSTYSTDDNKFREFIKNDFKPAMYDFKTNISKDEEEKENSENEIDSEMMVDQEIEKMPWYRQLGFIAQDIYDTEVGKSFVYEHDGKYSFSPSGFTTAIARALQEEIKLRDQQIEELRKEIELLKVQP